MRDQKQSRMAHLCQRVCLKYLHIPDVAAGVDVYAGVFLVGLHCATYIRGKLAVCGKRCSARGIAATRVSRQVCRCNGKWGVVDFDTYHLIQLYAGYGYSEVGNGLAETELKACRRTIAYQVRIGNTALATGAVGGATQRHYSYAIATNGIRAIVVIWGY
jgi:hypothetical protein